MKRIKKEEKKKNRKQLKNEKTHDKINEATALWTQAKAKIKTRRL